MLFWRYFSGQQLHGLLKRYLFAEGVTLTLYGSQNMAPLLGDAFYPCKSHHLVGDRGRANHCLTSPQQWGVGKWCFLLKLCNTYLRRVSWETVEMMYVLCYTVLCELSNK